MISFEDFYKRMDFDKHSDYDHDHTVYSSYIFFIENLALPGISKETEVPEKIRRELAMNLYNNLIEMFR